MSVLLKKSIGESFFFLILSVALVTLFSTCSPLYPCNPWMDANVFMTIGKNMLHGMMPYRDLFDLKGLLLFMLHEWAAFFCPHSFHAIYILQILCLWGLMVYSHKSVRLFCKTSITLPFVCLIALFTMTSDFYYYGDSVEEFSLPILAHSMYHFLRFVRDGKTLRARTGIAVGIGVGIIFWMKYSILTFYAGSFLAVLYIAWRRGKLSAVYRAVSWIACGFLAVSVPVLVYAMWGGILTDFIDVYFYSNIFKYHGVSTRDEMSWYEKTFPLVGYVIALATIGFSHVRKDVRLFVLMTFAGAASVLVFFKIPACNIYYYLILVVFLPLLIKYVRRWRVSRKNMTVFAFCAVAMVLLNYNLMTLLQGTFSPEILNVVDVVKRSGCGKHDLLLYKIGDKGVFVLTDCVPVVKHFFSVGVARIPGEQEMQDAYLASCKARFVVTSDVLSETSGYHLVCERADDPDRSLLTAPIPYLWHLGYTQPLMRIFMDKPEPPHTYIRLYERTE